jgi:hypothetical protein
MSLKRTQLGLLQWLRMPPKVQNQVGTQCATCHRAVDYEAFIEGEPNRTPYVKVLVRCHGQEELRRIDMGTIYWDAERAISMMRRQTWFEPNEQGERLHSAGGLPRVVALPERPLLVDSSGEPLKAS